MLDEIQTSLIYPFRDKRWLRKMWPLLILPLIPILGVGSIIFYNGWRLEMIKNIASGRLELPDLDLVKIFKNGLILWGIFSLYIFVPGLLCAILGISGPLAFIADVYEIYQQGFSSWSEDAIFDLLLAVSIYLIWALISVPMYHVGMIRFALSKQWYDLINLPINFVVLIRYGFSFLKYYLYALILSLIIIAVDMVFALTGIGLFFITLITISGYYVCSAYELGQLARKMTKKEPVKFEVETLATTH